MRADLVKPKLPPQAPMPRSGLVLGPEATHAGDERAVVMLQRRKSAPSPKCGMPQIRKMSAVRPRGFGLSILSVGGHLKFRPI